MDRSLPAEFAPEIDFEKLDYSEHNFTDLFNFNDITADKDSSNSDNKNDRESKNEETLLQKKKVEKNTKWSTSKSKSKLRKCSPCAVVKEKPGARLDVCIIKTELDAFFLFINKGMISQIV